MDQHIKNNIINYGLISATEHLNKAKGLRKYYYEGCIDAFFKFKDLNSIQDIEDLSETLRFKKEEYSETDPKHHFLKGLKDQLDRIRDGLSSIESLKGDD